MKLLRILSCLCLVALGCAVTTGAADGGPASQLVSVRKIWDAAGHNAFTDLTRFDGKWLCTFREADGHVRGNGRIRVITSADGEQWQSAALLSEQGIDLRDPKLCLTPDNRLMLVMGGSVYEGKVLKERQPRVSFSKDGQSWSTPQRVLNKGEWLWRVTWHKNRAYGISYKQIGSRTPTNEWRLTLFSSADGMDWKKVTSLAVPDQPNEATVRFQPNDECIALVRREAGDRNAWIGHSAPPYKKWQWHTAGVSVGGPNFIMLPNGGAMVAAGRQSNPKPESARTFVGPMTLESVKADLVLPSGGDCSYPGLVWHDGVLWLSYYSSHEGKTSIYLAKIKLPGQKP